MEVYYPDYPEKLYTITDDLLLLADSEDTDVDGKKKFKRIKVSNIWVFRSMRMTTTERDALVGLIGGEQIFNTTTNKHQGYDGSVWNDMY